MTTMVCFYPHDTMHGTKYRADKRYATTDSSLTGAYRWCSHLEYASETMLVMTSLPFWPRADQ